MSEQETRLIDDEAIPSARENSQPLEPKAQKEADPTLLDNSPSCCSRFTFSWASAFLKWSREEQLNPNLYGTLRDDFRAERDAEILERVLAE